MRSRILTTAIVGCVAAVCISGILFAQEEGRGAENGGPRLGAIQSSFAYGMEPHLEVMSVCMSTSRRGNYGTKGGVCTYDSSLSLEFNLDDAGVSKGGEMAFTIETRQGPGISSRHLGDIFGAVNFEERNFTQISELWFKKTSPKGNYFKLGLADFSSEFGAIDNGGDFVNSAFGYIPNISIPTWPDYGYVFIYNAAVKNDLYVRAGASDNSQSGDTSRFKTAFDSTYYALEIGYTTYQSEEEDGPRSIYRAGVFKSTGAPPAFNDGVLDNRGNNGFYIAADQSFSPSVNAFVQFGAAPDETNDLSRYAGAGVVFSNITKRRPFDTLGVAYGNGRINKYSREAGAGRGESVIEVYYKIQLSDTFTIMPDLQLIQSPGGLGEDNLLYGLKTDYSF